jgi:hypothetical protein
MRFKPGTKSHSLKWTRCIKLIRSLLLTQLNQKIGISFTHTLAIGTYPELLSKVSHLSWWRVVSPGYRQRRGTEDMRWRREYPVVVARMLEAALSICQKVDSPDGGVLWHSGITPVGCLDSRLTSKQAMTTSFHIIAHRCSQPSFHSTLQLKMHQETNQ